MRKAILLFTVAFLLSAGAQAQENKTQEKCDSCKVEKRDSCVCTEHCPSCKNAKCNMKKSKVKFMAHTLPLPLDSTCCNKCKENAPTKGIQKVAKKKNKIPRNGTVSIYSAGCFGGHDSLYHVYKDSFNTIKPFIQDCLKVNKNTCQNDSI